MKRYCPDELLARYQQIREGITIKAFFCDPAHKKTQEMWCATHFARGYESHYGECYVWISDKDEQTDADFHLEIASTRHPFQVTELMQPGRRRGDEYRNGGGESGRTALEDWSPGTEQGPVWVRAAIGRKVKKYYAGADLLNLLVYVNFPAYEQGYDKIVEECRAESQAFASVWLLNGNTICCIRGGDGFSETEGWLPVEESLANTDL